MATPGMTEVQMTPPAPTCTRAVPLAISTDDNASKIAYPSGHAVVVRDLADNTNLVCTNHTCNVTCARLSPNGVLCASGDKEGNLLIWVVRAGFQVKLNTKALGGAIRDISWTGDGERLTVVGEGKTSFGTCIGVSGNSIGTVSGHDKGIMSCDMKKTRPFRMMTGGQDAAVGYFEGPPFKFKHTISGKHENNVTAVKYNPAGDTVASVSGKDTIALIDGATGEFKSTIATGHTGTILGLSWSPDGQHIATASADKSVKVHAVNGDNIFSTSFGKAVGNMQQGITYFKDGILTVGFDNVINILDKESGKVTKTLRGHAKGAKTVQYLPDGRLFSVGREGSALLWSDESCTVADQAEPLNMEVVAGSFANAKSAVVGGGTDLAVIDLAAMKTTALEPATALVLDIAEIDETSFLVLHKAGIAVYKDGKKVALHPLENPKTGKKKADCSAFAYHAATNVLAVGADGFVFTFALEDGGKSLTPATVFEGHVQAGGEISAIAFNKSGTAIASGDSTRSIIVWEAKAGTVLFDQLVFHSSRVTTLCFSPVAEDLLLSGSVDNSVILWNLPLKKRVMQANAHAGGVAVVAFSPDGSQVLSSGGDGTLRKWTFPAQA